MCSNSLSCNMPSYLSSCSDLNLGRDCIKPSVKPSRSKSPNTRACQTRFEQHAVYSRHMYAVCARGRTWWKGKPNRPPASKEHLVQSVTRNATCSVKVPMSRPSESLRFQCSRKAQPVPFNSSQLSLRIHVAVCHRELGGLHSQDFS